jgi:hypothetical protein
MPGLKRSAQALEEAEDWKSPSEVEKRPQALEEEKCARALEEEKCARALGLGPESKSPGSYVKRR